MKWRLEKYDDEWWIKVWYDMIQLRKKEMVVVEMEALIYVGPNRKVKNEMVRLFRRLYGKGVRE